MPRRSRRCSCGDYELVILDDLTASKKDFFVDKTINLGTGDYKAVVGLAKAGQPVLLMYASANRDEREFRDPETFRIDRRPPRFLGFSHGTHVCLGMHAARVEGRIAVQEFLARFPDYEVIESGIERFPTEFVQGYTKMPVRLRPN